MTNTIDLAAAITQKRLTDKVRIVARKKLNEIARELGLTSQFMYLARQGKRKFTPEQIEQLEQMSLKAPYKPSAETSIRLWYLSIQNKKSLLAKDMAVLLGMSRSAYTSLLNGTNPMTLSVLKRTIVSLKLNRKKTDHLKELFFRQYKVPKGVKACTN